MALVTVLKAKLDAKALVDALKKEGFGGKVLLDKPAKQDPPGKKENTRRVVVHVAGMKKSLSGAT